MRRLPAGLSVLLLSVLIPACISSGGPAPSMNPKAVKDSASATACRANMKAIHASQQAYHAQKGSYGSLQDIERFSGPLPREPAGGSYSIDTATGRVTCSVGHGSAPEQ
ncbi:MAG: hypothetical protein C4521_04380 [Actinobacteria bacterium]|nr:MAG: hypothetical protein C4521_04380 [Actinomycetota bacterium]